MDKRTTVQANAEPAGTVKPKRLPPNAGKGRVKGVPNKATKSAREMITKIVEETLPEITDWIRQSAYGVGRAWVEWDVPEGFDPKVDRLPAAAKVFRKGGPVYVPLLASDGKVRVVSLLDIPTLPATVEIDWIVKPSPGDNPDKVLRALEYHIPKINRTEHTGADGAKLEPMTLVVEGVKAPKRD